MAGLNKLKQRVAGAFHLITAHRPGHVKDDADRHRRVVVAEKREFLLLFVVENCEGAFAQAGDVTSVGIRNRNGERDQIRVGD